MKIKYICIILLAAMAFPVMAQEESPNVIVGNMLYKQKKYLPAEIEYRRGLQKNSSAFEANFNLGNSLMEQEKYADAATQFERTVRVINPKKEKQKAAYTYHNLGNAYMQTGEFGKAIEAYKSSLRLNPKDDETRYNLVKAMQMQQQQPEQQQQEQEQQQQNKDQQQQNQDQQQQEQEQQQQAQQQEQQMDKETAERLLEALEQNEAETQEKLQQQKGSKRKVEKDW